MFNGDMAGLGDREEQKNKSKRETTRRRVNTMNPEERSGLAWTRSGHHRSGIPAFSGALDGYGTPLNHNAGPRRAVTQTPRVVEKQTNKKKELKRIVHKKSSLVRLIFSSVFTSFPTLNWFEPRLVSADSSDAVGSRMSPIENCGAQVKHVCCFTHLCGPHFVAPIAAG